MGGTIEKWSDKGWQIIEEYFDTCAIITDLDQGLDYLLSIYKSFILGIPISYKGKVDPEPPTSPDRRSDKTPNLRVLSFKDKVDAHSKKDEIKKPNKSDDPDFDWI